MRVKISQNGQERQDYTQQEHQREVILKLYDRRFAKSERSYAEAAYWKAKLESDYIRYLATYEARREFENWSEGDTTGAYPRWKLNDDNQREHWTHFRMEHAFTTECLAYERMKDMQGRRIPILHHRVRFQWTVPGSARHLDSSSCPGIILQYIPGKSLADHADDFRKMPRITAILKREESTLLKFRSDVFSLIADQETRGVCDPDAVLADYIVAEFEESKKKPVTALLRSSSRPHIFRIDFGNALLREQFDDDRAFERQLLNSNEESKIWNALERVLKTGSAYKMSARMQILQARCN